MRRGHHPGRMVDVEADVLVAHQRRLAGVQADAHPYGLVVGPPVRGEVALRLRGGAAGIERALEYAEKRVTLGPELAAVAALEGRAQDLVMGDLGLHVPITQLLHQARRSFHVGEEERDRADGQAHGADRAGMPWSSPFITLAASRW